MKVRGKIEVLRSALRSHFARPTAFLRTLIWAIVFFFAFVHVISRSMDPVTAASSEQSEEKFFGPKGYVDSIPEKDPDEFRIAWIGASESMLDMFTFAREHDTLGSVLVGHLSEDRLLKATAVEYVSAGSRLYRKYLYVLSARKHSPDLIVVSYNANDIYHDAASFAHLEAALPEAAQTLSLDWRSWALYGLLASPAQFAEGMVTRIHPEFQDRSGGAWKEMRRVADRVYDGDNDGKAAVPGAHEGGVIDLRTLLFDTELNNAIARQMADLRSYRKRPSRLATEIIFTMTVEAARDDGIPIVAFLAPINLAALDAELGEIAGVKEEQFFELVEGMDDPGVHVWSLMLDHGMTGEQFTDLFHMRGDVEPLMSKFADALGEKGLLPE